MNPCNFVVKYLGLFIVMSYKSVRFLDMDLALFLKNFILQVYIFIHFVLGKVSMCSVTLKENLYKINGHSEM